MRRFLLFCLPAVILLAVSPGVATAKSAGLTCGQTVTKSVTLKANLDCSAGGMDGLNIGKNGIVIDLNGHTITGGGGADHYDGIYNNGFDNVTVENGTIKNFYYDYYSQYAHHETVTKVTLVLDASQDYYGLFSGYGGSNTYSYNKVTNAYYGFYVYGTAGDTFTHNTVTGNLYGVYDEYAQHETWLANTFSYNADQGYYNDYGSPILIGNVANHNGADGFYIDCDSYGSAVVKNNVATHNGASGIYSYYCYDTGYYASTYSGNVTNSNGTYGLYSYYDWKAKFSGNTANKNTKNGFYFYESAGYIITKNTSNDNTLSGVLFYTDGEYYPHLFMKNSSSGNNSYGYESDYGLYGTMNTGSGNTSGLLYQVSG
jgi:parallel beta-helix repeat protein